MSELSTGSVTGDASQIAEITPAAASTANATASGGPAPTRVDSSHPPDVSQAKSEVVAMDVDGSAGGGDSASRHADFSGGGADVPSNHPTSPHPNKPGGADTVHEPTGQDSHAIASPLLQSSLKRPRSTPNRSPSASASASESAAAAAAGVDPDEP